MSDDNITIEQDSEERYVVRRSEHIADIIWDESVPESLGEPDISKGKWLLCRVGEADEELTEANGKDDSDTALKQARRLLGVAPA